MVILAKSPRFWTTSTIRILRKVEVPSALFVGSPIEYGISGTLLESMAQSRTVEGQIELLKAEAFSAEFWSLVEKRIAAQISSLLKHVEMVSVRLFQMDGKPLGGQP